MSAPIFDEQVRDLVTAIVTRQFAANSFLTDRMNLARGLGYQFNGERDLYDTAGYPRVLQWDDFAGRYARGDIAERLVDAPADESWSKPPHPYDGPDEKTGATDTPFCKAWQALAADGLSGKGLLSYLHRLDRVLGLGEYAVLYLGLADGKRPDEALAGKVRPDGLRYVSIFGQGDAQIGMYETDRRSARYGHPLSYNLKVIGPEGTEQETITAHWSRCVHVVEEPLTSDLVGKPRLRSVFNRLLDLEKIFAAAGEAAWNLTDPGRVISTKDGYELPTDPTARTELETQVEEFANRLRRWILMEGIDVNELTGRVTDPTGLININLDIIAGTRRIPKRILLGSERGELASSQDDVNWLRYIMGRQRNQVVPQILRPVATRLIELGLLPSPSSGQFGFAWEPLIDENRAELAAIAETIARTLQTLGYDVDPVTFGETLLPFLDAKALMVKAEPVPVVANPFDPANPAGQDVAQGDQPAANAAGPFRAQRAPAQDAAFWDLKGLYP